MSLRNFVLGFTIVVTPLLSQAKNLVVCTESNPEGFDVVQYNSLITTNASADVLFNRLVEYDAVNSKVVPGLAERWEIDADGLGYTFHLRRLDTACCLVRR